LHLVTRGKSVNGFDPSRQMRLVIDRIRELEVSPEFLIISGDLTDDAAHASYEVVGELVAELASDQTEVLLALGNHDDRAVFREVILGASDDTDRSPYYYGRVIDGLRVLVLDSTIPEQEEGVLGAEQLAWLEDELRSPSARGALIVLHHCCRLVSSPETVKRFLVRDVDALEAIVARHDIRGVLAGHAHQANSAKFGGTLYATAPAVVCQLAFSATGEITPVAASGFNVCRIQDGQLTVQPVVMPG
jgi:3',5'-cyclic AMP phosphodiesterase CpdA